MSQYQSQFSQRNSSQAPEHKAAKKVALPDFDTLKHMAETDPAALEQLRQQKTAELIQQAPEAYQQRLRGLQFQVDAQRQLAKNPMQSCLKVSNMMHESFAQLREKLNAFSKGNNQQEDMAQTDIDKPRADILRFPS